MLPGMINEQGHSLDMRDDISETNEYFSHVFPISLHSLWCLNLRNYSLVNISSPWTFK